MNYKRENRIPWLFPDRGNPAEGIIETQQNRSYSLFRPQGQV